jgi:hypothetical protein
MIAKTQFSVVLANKRGELARFGELLGRAGVNIEALSISEGLETGVLKLVVDGPDAARAALRDEGLPFTERQIVAVSLPNQPGALAELCHKLAAEGHSIDAVYGSTCADGAAGPGTCRPQLMLSVEDLDAVDALRSAAIWPGPGA